MTQSLIRKRLSAFAIAAIGCTVGLMYDRAIRKPEIVHAQDQFAAWLYIEPGVTNVITPDGNRRFLGKVAIDLRNGNIWGLPTLQASPYPRDHTTSTPPSVEPVFLGRYDLAPIEARR